jgi:aspartokinase/homoserine dehydrogenase 1
VALAAARASGLTEPDPRQDLGGRDVQRKLLILGRTAGWPLEAESITVESLFSPSLAHLDVQEFMMASVAIDPSMRERVNAAGAAGEVLRYIAVVQPGGGQVGLKAVPADAAQANLKFVSFQTARYAEHPLIVGSNSGGVQTTAAAVLGDMVSLAREWSI